MLSRSRSISLTRPSLFDEPARSAFSRSMRKRETVSVSLLRMLSWRASMSCSVVLISNSCARIRRNSGVFSCAPRSKSFCLSLAIFSTLRRSWLRSFSSRSSCRRNSARVMRDSGFLRLVSHSIKETTFRCAGIMVGSRWDHTYVASASPRRSFASPSSPVGSSGTGSATGGVGVSVSAFDSDAIVVWGACASDFTPSNS